MIKIQKEDFDIDSEIKKIKSLYPDIGAVSIFIGYVRNINEKKEVKSINLDVYKDMAIKQLKKTLFLYDFWLKASQLCSVHRNLSFEDIYSELQPRQDCEFRHISAYCFLLSF